jgi:hypothetical protein
MGLQVQAVASTESGDYVLRRLITPDGGGVYYDVILAETGQCYYSLPMLCQPEWAVGLGRNGTFYLIQPANQSTGVPGMVQVRPLGLVWVQVV